MSYHRTEIVASETVGKLDASLAYYAKHSAALFPIPAGQKAPFGLVVSFKHDFSRDPSQWVLWQTQHPNCNFGVVAFASSWIIVDIDTSGGEEGAKEAWAIWRELCASWGLSEAPDPHVRSQSGGFHVYFAVPAGVDASTLRQPDAIKGRINIRCVGYTVAAGSQFEGKPYRLINDIPPHPAPAALIEHCTRRARVISASLPGQYDKAETAALVTWMVENEMFESYEEWFTAGMALKTEFGSDGFDLWELTHDGTVSPSDADVKWQSFSDAPGGVTLRTLFDRAHKAGWKGSVKKTAASMFADVPVQVGAGMPIVPSPPLAPLPLPDHPELTAPQANALSKFWAHLPSGKIIHAPSRMLWAAGSFDKHIGRIKGAMALATGPGMLASTWSSQNRFVHSMGWAPGEPEIVEDRILTDDGWIRVPGERSFNLYLPPDIEHIEGDVSRWLDLIKFIYPEEWQHIVQYFAFKAQNPGIKINHGLVFIGAPGIGKDTIVEPVIAAIGPHNFQGVPAPVFFNSDFNGYLKAVLLRIDEVHDLGGESKYAFHDRTKTVIAAPPPSHRINVKHVPHHAALNVNGTIETSNHWDALYLPADDRRHFVCISERRKEDFREGYFTGADGMYAWFGNGGNEAVAHYLANLDISAFDAKADPPKTSGWHRIVNAGLAPEGGELLDIIEALGKPAALTLGMIRDKAPYGTDLRMALDDPKRRRTIPKRLAEVGYVVVLNRDAADGRWPAKPVKTMIYARQELSEDARQTAARFRAAGFSPPS
jgi:hypothetical protein